MTNLNKAAVGVKETFATAHAHLSTLKSDIVEKLANVQNDDERAELDKARMRAETHEKFNAALTDMSAQALNYLAKLDISAEALTQQSRELKKRCIKMIEAIAHSKTIDDRALESIVMRLAQKNDASLTLAQIQREMQHDTTTQAQYFKSCALFFNFASYSKSDKTVTFKYDAKVLKDLIALYSKEEVVSE